MTDIVERLRASQNAFGGKLVLEAADEIERLRGAVIVLSVALREICNPPTVAADAETLGALHDLHELISARARQAIVDAGLKP
jgi:hypothetical protein